MLAKLELYADTIKSMKASQIYYRIRKMLKMNCSLGCSVSSGVERAKPIATVSMLDFDSAFLERFPADEILTDKVTFLHTSEEFHWNQKWHFDDNQLYGISIYTILSICSRLLMHIKRLAIESILINQLKSSAAGLRKIRKETVEKVGLHIRLT